MPESQSTPDLVRCALDEQVKAIAGYVDFGYVRKKLKIVAARDRLVELAFDKPNSHDIKVETLLRIAGETPPHHLAKKVRDDYTEKRNWNLRWILVPIYVLAPLLGAIVCFLLTDKSHWSCVLGLS
jgi:hypothetical protein